MVNADLIQDAVDGSKRAHHLAKKAADDDTSYQRQHKDNCLYGKQCADDLSKLWMGGEQGQSSLQRSYRADILAVCGRSHPQLICNQYREQQDKKDQKDIFHIGKSLPKLSLWRRYLI